MPKHTFSVGAKAAEAVFDGDNGFYEGDKPPVGIYAVVLKKVRLKQNKNDEDMLNILFEVTETGDKAKYNGYGVWTNMNVTDQGAPYINAWLDAIGAKKAVFWGEGGVILDDEDPPNVIKIGTKRMEGITLRIATKDDKYDGNVKLVPTRYLTAKAADDEDDDGFSADEPAGDEGVDDAIESVPEPEADDTATDEAGADEPDVYTKADLKAFDLNELRQLADYWEVEYPPKANKSAMEKLLWEFQESGTPAEAEPDAEDQADEGPEEDKLTEEEIGKMSPEELQETLVDLFGGTMPKPPLKSRVIKEILRLQDEKSSNEPPF